MPAFNKHGDDLSELLEPKTYIYKIKKHLWSIRCILENIPKNICIWHKHGTPVEESE